MFNYAFKRQEAIAWCLGSNYMSNTHLDYDYISFAQFKNKLISRL